MRYVILLDRSHLEDRLFARQFARSLAELTSPVILVHGAAEEAERALEADGKIVQREDGVIKVGDEEERRTVEVATLGLNRRLVDEMTDEGLATIRVDGSSRSLLQSHQNGTVEAPRGGWLWGLAAQKVVPVVAALVPGPGGGLDEANAGAVAAALANGEEDSAVVFLTGDRRSIEEWGIEDVRERLPHLAAEFEAARLSGVTAGLIRPRDLAGTTIDLQEVTF